jgi:hypothetical protein
MGHDDFPKHRDRRSTIYAALLKPNAIASSPHAQRSSARRFGAFDTGDQSSCVGRDTVSLLLMLKLADFDCFFSILNNLLALSVDSKARLCREPL